MLGFVSPTHARTMAVINKDVILLSQSHRPAAGSPRPGGAREAAPPVARGGDGQPRPGEPRMLSAEKIDEMLEMALQESLPRLLQLLWPDLDEHQRARVTAWFTQPAPGEAS